ncbi:RNA-binding protein 42 [Phytophthora pseudosyringae]|uniref:RNA-binding protein 42 n=1 Tax=Phytophthora pseudosyringae TaxID=221518 RepID=A0A8T1W226_9STRA|nr:RNA-binding protein 42 [Phytophthora pseudosyringae]
MADLDDEFARFEAEIQSLEQQAEAPDGDEKVEPAAQEEDASAAKKAKTVAAAAKPKIYMAPPRPAPVKKKAQPIETPAEAEPTDGRPRMLNTLEDVAAHRGALSGFPAGTTGEHAATVASRSSTAASYRSLQPRVDMETGHVLSMEEQEMMNRQQSVYEYDPKRTAASIAAGPQGRDGAAGPGGEKKQKRHLRLAGGQVWEDQTLEDWPDNDFRLFCGDLGNEVSDELLAHSFAKYPSFQRARVVRDKLTHKSRGYGFVSFTDPFDCAKALREMNGKYIGNRPVKLSKSKWQDRNIDVAKKKMRKRKHDKHHLFN